ncbi:MAG: molybdopterin converting factor subunit 1 [Methylococcaceae bacterium]|nr:molybdopterin converting factor subunit 1 [Methylococcaceae bacterium]
MSIRVRFFASLREQMGYSEKSIAFEGLATVSDVLERLDKARILDAQVLYAVNMEYANSDTPVKDGDEVAFFPPVTGGGP